MYNLFYYGNKIYYLYFLSKHFNMHLHEPSLKNIPRTVKVYDVEKKELLGTFPSIYEAAKFAGIGSYGVAQYIKFKYRCHTNKLNKILAFR
jgi:hypothetical protein